MAFSFSSSLKSAFKFWYVCFLFKYYQPERCWIFKFDFYSPKKLVFFRLIKNCLLTSSNLAYMLSLRPFNYKQVCFFSCWNVILRIVFLILKSARFYGVSHHMDFLASNTRNPRRRVVCVDISITFQVSGKFRGRRRNGSA